MRRAVGLLVLLALVTAAPTAITRPSHAAAARDAALQSESPKIFSVSRSGKNLIIVGEGFQAGAVIFINGERQKTRNDEQNPDSLLIAKKAAKRLPPDAVVTIQVQNSEAAKSDPFAFFTGLTLTIDDSGKTFHLSPGQQFLLLVKVNDIFDITVSVDQTVIKKVADGEGIPGAQAIYEAERTGQVQLSVVLDPKCGKLRPACGIPSQQYLFNFVIE
jgi:hypothetical protein